MWSRLKNADIPAGSLRGKVIVVTGGNVGIGLETVIQLARAGATVYMASRTESKANNAIATIEPESARERVKYLHTDLSTIGGSKKAAKELLSLVERLDVVICNAGIMMVPYELNEDGIEIQIATNHVGHFTFVTELLPLLLKTAEQTQDVRIITVASLGHYFALRPWAVGMQYRTLADLNSTCGPDFGLPISTARRYGYSKGANILFAREVERRYGARGVHGIATHPGLVRTDLFDGITSGHALLWNYIVSPVLKPFWMDIPQGASPALIAATAPASEVTGEAVKNKLIEPGGRKAGRFVGPLPYVQDDRLAKELWELSEAIVKHKGGQ